MRIRPGKDAFAFGEEARQCEVVGQWSTPVCRARLNSIALNGEGDWSVWLHHFLL